MGDSVWFSPWMLVIPLRKGMIDFKV